MPGPGFYLSGEEEKKEVIDVMDSGYYFRYGQNSNPKFKHKVETLEKEFSNHIGTKYSIALTSGTAALMTCMAALGIGPGDEVIVPGYTFIASISSIIYSRAIPILSEINESLTIDPDDIENKISNKTKAIMPVHMLGNPCNMDKILKIARKNKLFVIEDACQAVGGSYKGHKLGNLGDIGAFSLNVFKVINSGDGGIVTTDDIDYYDRAFAFHDQGHKPVRKGKEVGFRGMIGMNFRMNELTGAVALAQLRKIDTIIETLREKKKKLKEIISTAKNIKFRKINDDGECATILTLIFDNEEKARRFAEKIGSKTVNNSGWHVYNNMENILNKKMPTAINCPFVCPYYDKDINYKVNMLPRTDEILKRSVNISIGVIDSGIGADYGISILSDDKEIEKVGIRIKEIFDEIY